MSFERLPEHEMLRESVRAFFDRELPETKIRDMDRARHVPDRRAHGGVSDHTRLDA